MKPYRVLTDEEWLAVAPLLPELQPRKETRGRPLTNTREVLNGVLWVMHSGSSWSMLPRRFPSYQTCHRRFKAWQRTGVLKHVLNELFGPAGDEFHTAIVARMRNAQPATQAAKLRRGDTGGGTGPAGPDRVWDAAPLQHAFAPMPTRAPLMAAEGASSIDKGDEGRMTAFGTVVVADARAGTQTGTEAETEAEAEAEADTGTETDATSDTVAGPEGVARVEAARENHASGVQEETQDREAVDVRRAPDD